MAQAIPLIAGPVLRTIDFMERNRVLTHQAIRDAATGHGARAAASVASGLHRTADQQDGGDVHGAGTAGLRDPGGDAVELHGDRVGDGDSVAHLHPGSLRQGVRLEAHDVLERIREQYRLFAAFEEQVHADCILELLERDAAAHDPDWRRPAVMGKKPRQAVIDTLEDTQPDEQRRLA